jgi:hypothetical protein
MSKLGCWSGGVVVGACEFGVPSRECGIGVGGARAELINATAHAAGPKSKVQSPKSNQRESACISGQRVLELGSLLRLLRLFAANPVRVSRYSR